jgi:hypothetical protein
LIYESPDGGKTVYSRQLSSAERTLIYESKEVRLAHRWTKFEAIVRLAETEPALNDALEKVEMLYNLLKDNERN